jgi:hypothetical protein
MPYNAENRSPASQKLRGRAKQQGWRREGYSEEDPWKVTAPHTITIKESLEIKVPGSTGWNRWRKPLDAEAKARKLAYYDDVNALERWHRRGDVS